MSSIDQLTTDFLAQKRIAVTGVSTKREDAANHNYRKFRDAGYTVYAINPNLQEFEGAKVYPDLRSLPEIVDGVFIVNRPEVSLEIVKQCVDLGIKRVWMHCSLGTKPVSFLKTVASTIGSASDEAVRLCKENGISVIPGACAMMYLNPDGGHKFMRGALRLMGSLKMD